MRITEEGRQRVSGIEREERVIEGGIVTLKIITC